MISKEPTVTPTSESPDNAPLSDTLKAVWENNFQTVRCEHCDWAYMAPADEKIECCPHCQAHALHAIEGSESDPTITDLMGDLAKTDLPEKVAPFSVSAQTIEAAVQRFAAGVPFAPRDLNAANLRRRLRRIFLPVWMVDVNAQAAWKGEAGFNYQVVSHQEKFEQTHGGWSTREVHETRIRWEPRLGTLKRSYTNLTTPATKDYHQIIAQIGEFKLEQAQPFTPEAILESWVRLPDRLQTDAWTEAEPKLKNSAAEECRQATGADYIRQFSWAPTLSDQNWTLLLLPALSSFYLDDEGKRQAVFLNGQSGGISGMRKASQKRAQQVSLMLAAIAAGLFLLSVGLVLASVVFPPAVTIGIIGGLIALLTAAGAVVPVAVAWGFNRRQSVQFASSERA